MFAMYTKHNYVPQTKPKHVLVHQLKRLWSGCHPSVVSTVRLSIFKPLNLQFGPYNSLWWWWQVGLLSQVNLKLPAQQHHRVWFWVPNLLLCQSTILLCVFDTENPFEKFFTKGRDPASRTRALCLNTFLRASAVAPSESMDAFGFFFREDLSNGST